jgi:hypothetical protein
MATSLTFNYTEQFLKTFFRDEMNNFSVSPVSGSASGATITLETLRTIPTHTQWASYTDFHDAGDGRRFYEFSTKTTSVDDKTVLIPESDIYSLVVNW